MDFKSEVNFMDEDNNRRTNGEANSDDEDGADTLNSTDREKLFQGRISTSISYLLAGYGDNVAEIFTASVIKNKINFSNLNALTDEDLIVLGVKNPNIRHDLLNHFKCLPNVEDHYDKRISETHPNEYKDVVLQNLAAHLSNLSTSMTAVQYKVLLGQCENVLIDDRTYTSKLIIKLLNEIIRNAQQIEEKLKPMKDRNNVRHPNEQLNNNNLWKRFGTTILGIGFGTFLIYNIYKYKFSTNFI